MSENQAQSGAALGCEILKSVRDELYGCFPFLDGAFAIVQYRCTAAIPTIGTDGEAFCFDSGYLCRTYLAHPACVRRGYLHMLLHCLYFHLFRPKDYEAELWNLACDLTVEQVIEKQKIAGLSLGDDPVRERTFARMEGMTTEPGKLYEMLRDGRFADSREALVSAFCFDDHRLWDAQQDPARAGACRSKWEEVLLHLDPSQGSPMGRRGSFGGSLSETVQDVQTGRYDYHDFLQRFAVPREEMELDLESFDYIYYLYGLDHYGNMPLLEPLEYREVNRVDELVIAIDTSSSCSVETVQRFLGQTYAILSRKENFFRKMQVVFLQCDCFVQEETVIHSREEWKAYMDSIHIQGRSGTDFRPVFRRVEELRRSGKLHRPRALIYFTDGDGIYPQTGPDYETAFVFLKDQIRLDRVPDWAERLLVPDTES